MKSGSFEDFQVVVDCQETLPSRSIRRRVSRPTAGTTDCFARCSASLVRLQVEKAVMRQSAGDVRAIRQMCSRTSLLIVLGRPPLHFGSSASNPRSLKAWMTSRTQSALTCINEVISGTD